MKIIKAIKKYLATLNEELSKCYICPNCGNRISHWRAKRLFIDFSYNEVTKCAYKTLRCPSCSYLMGVRIPKERIKE